MSDYISREAAKRIPRIWITDCEMYGDKDAANHFRDFIDILDELPAADVAPVVRGKWIQEDFGLVCSNCGGKAMTDGDYRQVQTTNCPNCGARMDGEEA